MRREAEDPVRLLHRRKQLIEGLDHEQYLLQAVDLERLSQNCFEGEWPPIALPP